ncbi:MAG TPA: hypothetical protein VJK48_04255 [Chlamydiales bacterium]|nr:hypothetical protein [Chlamydiales bacterium]
MFTYYLIRFFSFPLQWLPLSWIRLIGKAIGSSIFHLVPRYRKRALSNLGLATELKLTKEEQYRIAKESFQNVAIVCLEYPRLWVEKSLSPAIYCKNPEVAQELHDQGKGIIFFCGHLSNWETLFLEGTWRMKGIAIGKPIKNKRLYRWIVAIREKYGGKIIAQKDAVKEGLRALKKGFFIGIVGDQGMPSSGYSFPFLGRRAWTSTAPALLAYRTGCPILVVWTRRTKKGYEITYSDPIWPNSEEPIERETVRMMDLSLTLLQDEIRKGPGEWLWQHNRWKQQTPKNVYKQFRHDSVCLILPPNPEKFLPHLSTFRKIYPLDFLLICAPNFCREEKLIEADEIFYYQNIEETLLDDYRCKLVFNFSDFAPIKHHYLSLSAFEVLDFPKLKKLADPHLPPHLKEDVSEILKRALCRPGSLWEEV